MWGGGEGVGRDWATARWAVGVGAGRAASRALGGRRGRGAPHAAREALGCRERAARVPLARASAQAVGVPSLPKNRGTGASKQRPERLAKQSKLSTHGDEQRKQHNGLN